MFGYSMIYTYESLNDLSLYLSQYLICLVSRPVGVHVSGKGDNKEITKKQVRKCLPNEGMKSELSCQLKVVARSLFIWLFYLSAAKRINRGFFSYIQLIILE